jgi:hypothetical protein
MLVPRFTIRTILAVTTGCAVFFLVVGTAFRGQNWAWGVAFGVLSLAVTALVHAACFGMVWLFAELFAPRHAASGAEAWLTAADLLTPIARPAPLPPPVVPPPRGRASASNEQEDSV